FDGASASIYPAEKVGVIGRNGCGKSTLFSAIMGELAPEDGSISIPKGSVIASVSQKTPALDMPAIEYVIEGDKQLSALLKKKDEIYAQGDGVKIAEIEDQLGIAGAWTVRPRAEELLHGLGFSQDEIEKPVKDFSGGWRMRLNLAQALICRSDLLLLDEPTNHLDLDTVIFLENYLKTCKSTILCISHDRDFLDRFCDHILHFESGKLVMYTGNYSDFERLRAERIKNERANRKREEAVLAHMQSFVDRFRYKASKARQAQSLIKAIDKLKLTAVTQEESPYNISFPDPERTVDVLATIKELDAGYEAGKPVLRNVNLMLLAGDRIGLLGRNGQGKSTFIKTLCSVIPPLGGTVTIGKGVKIGYFAQHEMESLRPGLTALDHLHLIDKNARDKDLRTFLGSFYFQGDKAVTPVGTMSGGEQARLCLALIAYQRPNLLLLDEPTNHLDLDMRESLSVALATYPGALMVVSHDRHLLESTVDRLWLVDNGSVREFEGDLDDYQSYLIKENREFAEKISGRVQATRSSAAAAEEQQHRQAAHGGRELRRAQAAFRESLKPLKTAISKLEKELD
ncbi:MAG: ATP-binding cassette domain-containing protein, partial [Succinivibrio sp.]